MSVITSESVSPGHPDKIADQIADAVLDAILGLDPYARVACECLIKENTVILAGEISTHAAVNFVEIVKKTLAHIGYDDTRFGCSIESVQIIDLLTKQSEEISQGLEHSSGQLGAGDQGMMFGYACQETPSSMPLTITLAHQLMQQQHHLFRNKILPWLGPDAKAQVTLITYQDKPIAIKNITISTQHLPEVNQTTLKEAVMETLIKPCLPNQLIHPQTTYHINPSGSFIQGGPSADCGLTGRKIISDTYGSASRHGGGSFSGKDPSKIDRSGAYMARLIAKSIVDNNLAKRCELQLAYIIGQPNPIATKIQTFGTGKYPEDTLLALIHKQFDLTPQGIIETLNLLQPIYFKTACFGHFGREPEDFTWERSVSL